jgi:pyruvate dehydrogenase E1 component beta subunit
MDIKRAGSDITLIAVSRMVHVALEAATELEKEGVDAEVVDPRTLSPLDEDTLVASVQKTSRCVVVDEGYQRYGITAEIASIVAEKAFGELAAPVLRLGARDVPIPFSPVLEDQTIPSPADVIDLARQLMRY